MGYEPAVSTRLHGTSSSKPTHHPQLTAQSSRLPSPHPPPPPPQPLEAECPEHEEVRPAAVAKQRLNTRDGGAADRTVLHGRREREQLARRIHRDHRSAMRHTHVVNAWGKRVTLGDATSPAEAEHHRIVA